MCNLIIVFSSRSQSPSPPFPIYAIVALLPLPFLSVAHNAEAWPAQWMVEIAQCMDAKAVDHGDDEGGLTGEREGEDAIDSTLEAEVG